MNVTVNDRAVETPADVLPSDAGLDTLLDDLKKRGDIPADEVVVSLEVNGHRWTSEDMDRLGTTTLRDVARVAVGTAGVQQYGGRVLDDAASMLKVVREATQSVAREFRQGAPEQANEHLFLLLDAIHSFFSCTFRVMNICAPEQTAVQSQNRLIQGITSSLDSIQASQEKQDWAALADRLESELVPALDECGGLISRLQKEL